MSQHEWWPTWDWASIMAFTFITLSTNTHRYISDNMSLDRESCKILVIKSLWWIMIRLNRQVSWYIVSGAVRPVSVHLPKNHRHLCLDASSLQMELCSLQQNHQEVWLHHGTLWCPGCNSNKCVSEFGTARAGAARRWQGPRTHLPTFWTSWIKVSFHTGSKVLGLVVERSRWCSSASIDTYGSMGCSSAIATRIYIH